MVYKYWPWVVFSRNETDKNAPKQSKIGMYYLILLHMLSNVWLWCALMNPGAGWRETEHHGPSTDKCFQFLWCDCVCPLFIFTGSNKIEVVLITETCIFSVQLWLEHTTQSVTHVNNMHNDNVEKSEHWHTQTNNCNMLKQKDLPEDLELSAV